MLKLNVGFTKKVGESNYGSRGAAVNLELELDSGLAGDADRLKDRIRQLFALAKTSVDAELASAASPASVGAVAKNGHSGNGQGSGSPPTRRRDGTRPATASQVRALNVIADRKKLDLSALLRERFQIPEAAALTITEASSLIDELKGETAGRGQGGGR